MEMFTQGPITKLIEFFLPLLVVSAKSIKINLEQTTEEEITG